MIYYFTNFITSADQKKSKAKMQWSLAESDPLMLQQILSHLALLPPKKKSPTTLPDNHTQINSK